MSDPNQPQDLEPADQLLGDRLLGQRPVPGPAFRGALARYLAARDPGWGPRPANLRLVAGLCTASGAALIGIGALIGVGAV
jgi:hypothetical protein